MRRVAAIIAAVPLLAIAFPAAAGTSIVVRQDPGPGGFMSPNVTYVGTIPLDSPGVGGKVVKVGDQTRFYVTGLKGISIYDVSDPALPVPLGHLPFPHSQNEDVDVSADGSRLVIAADGSLLLPVAPHSTGIHVFDTSNPAVITYLGSSPLVNKPHDAFPTNVQRRAEHTATCADEKCEWIYGRTGTIYDATDPADIKIAGDWRPADGDPARPTQIHALIRDEAGLVIADSTPRLVLDPRENPAAPTVLAFGRHESELDTRLQHNSVRPLADQWQPREPLGEDATEEEIAEYAKLRPGELLIGNSESNLNTGCSSAGGLSTWSMKDFDKGATLQQIESFRPFNGDWQDGNPAINALGCSGHWFTENDNFVTAGWYEHGIRFFQIDPTNGDIEQVGFFQPVATEASAAHWVDDEYVYTVDYARGIDILRFDRGGPLPMQAEFDASWLANLDRQGALADRERYLCGLAGSQG